MRLSGNEYYLNIAKAVSRASTCRRRQYGSIIVRYNGFRKRGKISSTGYNGNPSGINNCSDMIKKCPRSEKNIEHNTNNYVESGCRSLHSEANCVIQAGEELCKGSTLYIYGFDLEENKEIINPQPCPACLGILLNAGVLKFVNNTGEYPIERNMGIYSGEHE